MCTAITYSGTDHYFGRNLDLERSYHERIVITPRKYPFQFRNGVKITDHYALIGMAAVFDEYPLYFEATNEMGLSMAGLNFPENAVYYQESTDKDNIAPFELISWILCQCKNLQQAKELLERLNLWSIPFSETMPLSPLHWIIADKSGCLTLETTETGMKIYDNPVGILTNNPCFDFHLQNLSNYLSLTSRIPENRFSDRIELHPYSLGMGAIGLPGDPSSASRFVRAAFTKLNSVPGEVEIENVSQFFHILGSVAQQKGVTMVSSDEFEYTMYSSCCNTDKGIYYYTTYGNSRISAINMFHENLNRNDLIQYPKADTQDILYVNEMRAEG